ncbi:sugar fermentation stimulation protein [cyanobacterium endosymbiont of Rhopalodia gibberula]|uniref:DNA/RNA nuclease SfsA n=1 Tax=cyanobacterium endosymbiont of Rhopalodia gibberula TaxID=1763363 RepID=UPI000DC73824|nr:DNA/RNA nuclease SfsA [cyanobacterium endosymbiont of Rhopalodia gibberula]BBA79503.1 sugar fermentation stimulation protein [cyanobacterium endosymbiont of Rhopalodia gibberula]
MSSDFIYSYPPLISGILIRRYKRFIADIELETGKIITAHCANTGPMIGVSRIGSRVYVSKSDNPKRKLAYTWEMVNVEGVWVGINTALPNKVIKLALEQQNLLELAGQYTQVHCEVPYGSNKKSRIDFLLTQDGEKSPIYIEVKNTTLSQGTMALFPDTVTSRGQKHLKELISLLPDVRPIMLYFISRKDCYSFAPGDNFDATYGKLLRKAVNEGVEILPYRFEVTPEGIRHLGLAEFLTSSLS